MKKAEITICAYPFLNYHLIEVPWSKIVPYLARTVCQRILVNFFTLITKNTTKYNHISNCSPHYFFSSNIEYYFELNLNTKKVTNLILSILIRMGQIQT